MNNRYEYGRKGIKQLADLEHRGTRILCEWIFDRIKNNKNFLGAWIGQTGSGKSYGAIRLAELLDPTFNVDRICLRAKDFMDILKNKEEIKSGSVIIYDECGIGMDSRNWYSIINKMINYVLQVFRYKNLIVFFTVPDINFIDKNARRLLHMYFQPDKILKSERILTVVPRLIKTNPVSGDTIHPYLRARGSIDNVNLGNILVKKIFLKKPSVKLRNLYEKKKQGFGNELLDSAYQEIKNANDLTSTKLTEKQYQIYVRLKEGKTQVQIAKELNSHQSNVSEQVRLIRRKGYDV